MSKITQFLLNRGCDHRHRTLSTILEFDDSLFDECHDFIQWMFPLPVGSKFFAGNECPILIEDDIYDIRLGSNSEKIKANIKLSVDRFLSFLGLDLRSKVVNNRVYFMVALSINFSEKAGYWLKANDHNHLRINRMLQFLVLAGLEDWAKAIFQCLSMIKCEFPDCITDNTMVYWRNALTGYSY